MVRELGITTYEGYDPANLDWRPDLVLIGNALSRGNPEVEEVLRRRIRYQSLPEWLKENVLWRRKPVVITGTHGKTTTSALTAFLLDACGRQPGYLIGGEALNMQYSSALGCDGGEFVIEGDEYDTAFFDKRAKFFHYLPEIAVVTGIEFDHGDIYADVEEIERAFRLMLRQIPPGGWLVASADDPRALSLLEHAKSRPTTYGFSEKAYWRGEETGVSAGYSGLVVYRGEQRFAELAVPLFGRHNLSNVLASVAVAGLLGISPDDIQQALLGFRGVRRRMEVLLEAGGRVYVDDFAHHPTAIEATLEASRERWPDSFIVAVVEPRSNTMVRNTHAVALINSLARANKVILGPIYREDRIPEPERLDRLKIAQALKKRGVECQIADGDDEIDKAIANVEETPAVFIIMSNGAFGGLYDRLKSG
jgi:UDP-N-acetylmuramate: L-alanyl-gamma-D-glutamyl-meso-diaminopimelate ligase